MNVLFLVNFILLIHEIFSVRMIVNHQNKVEQCVNKLIEIGETITLSYVVSGGYYLDNCNVYLYDPNSIMIYHNYNDQKGNFDNFNTIISGVYKLCFKPLTNAKMSINFDFHILSEIEELKELAKDELGNDITSINNIFEKIHRNVEFIQSRNDENYKFTQNTIDSLKNLTYLKGMIIVIVSIIQIYFMTKIISRRLNNQVTIAKGKKNIYL